MFAGLALLLAGGFLIALAVLLPRLHAQITGALDSVPREFQDMAATMVPGMAQGRAVIRFLPPIAKGCGIGGGLLALLGLFAFASHSVPLWLNAVAALAFLGVLGLAVVLAVVAQKLRPYLKEFLETKNRLKF